MIHGCSLLAVGDAWRKIQLGIIRLPGWQFGSICTELQAAPCLVEPVTTAARTVIHVYERQKNPSFGFNWLLGDRRQWRITRRRSSIPLWVIIERVLLILQRNRSFDPNKDLQICAATLALRTCWFMFSPGLLMTGRSVTWTANAESFTFPES